jgi:hypothetical protein
MSAKVDSRGISFDSQSLVNVGSNVLGVRAASSGAIERTVDGINVKAQGITDAMLAGSISFNKLADAANIARLDQAENIAAVWAFGTYLPTASADPTSSAQLCRKGYVDALVSGLTWKSAVRALGATNVTLSGLQTIDGVSLADGERILLVGQTTASQNGIWAIGTGAWARPTDFAAGSAANGAACFVSEGTAYGDTQYLCTTDVGSDVVDTDSLTWTQQNGITLTAGDGLVQVGNAFDVNPGNGVEISGDAVTLTLDGSSLSLGANGIKISDAGVTFAMIASAAIGTTSSHIAAGNHDHGASGASASQYWGLSAGSVLGWNDLPSGGSQRTVEKFTLDATDITNEYITLAGTPGVAGEVILLGRGFGNFFYASDYVMDGGYPTRLKWTGLTLAAMLESGDKLTVIY